MAKAWPVSFSAWYWQQVLLPVFCSSWTKATKNVFKELTQPKQSEEPEILKPQDKAEKRPATDNSSSQADEEKAKAEKEAAEKEAKAKEAAEKAAKEAEEKAAQAEKEAQEKPSAKPKKSG